jgi:deoxyuridine 5''-triphosphate nucleotidohydrolase (dut)
MDQKIKVICSNPKGLPQRSTSGAGAVDLHAKLGEGVIIYRVVMGVSRPTQTDCITLLPGERALIPSGLRIQLPKGYKLRLSPRSGLALKYGITLVNSPSLIDEDYTGDIGIILMNSGFDSVLISNGDRIAQAYLEKDIPFEWEEVDTLDTTDRGDGGFGSTGA